MTTYHIEIDRTLCSGFGSCAEHAPHLFELDSGGTARPLADAADDEAVLDAAASCPMGAIALIEVSAAKQAA
jgi:ferredoxin